MKNELSIPGLGLRTKAALQALLKSPTVEAALADADRQKVQERAAMVARLEGLPEAHEKAVAAAVKRQNAADAATEKAKQQTAAALEMKHQAAVELMSAQSVKDGAAANIERNLLDSADPRLQSFASFVTDVQMRLRNVLPWGAEKDRASKDAWAALTTARDQVLAMRMAAMSRTEITNSLRAISARLRPLLAVFDLRPPRTLDDHVLPPLDGGQQGDVFTPYEAESLDIAHRSEKPWSSSTTAAIQQSCATSPAR